MLDALYNALRGAQEARRQTIEWGEVQSVDGSMANTLLQGRANTTRAKVADGSVPVVGDIVAVGWRGTHRIILNPGQQRIQHVHPDPDFRNTNAPDWMFYGRDAALSFNIGRATAVGDTVSQIGGTMLGLHAIRAVGSSLLVSFKPTGSNPNPGTDNTWLLARMDVSGTLQWQTVLPDGFPSQINTSGDRIYVIENPNSLFGFNPSIFGISGMGHRTVRLDKATGTIDWTRTWTVSTDGGPVWGVIRDGVKVLQPVLKNNGISSNAFTFLFIDELNVNSGLSDASRDARPPTHTTSVSLRLGEFKTYTQSSPFGTVVKGVLDTGAPTPWTLEVTSDHGTGLFTLVWDVDRRRMVPLLADASVSGTLSGVTTFASLGTAKVPLYDLDEHEYAATILGYALDAAPTDALRWTGFPLDRDYLCVVGKAAERLMVVREHTKEHDVTFKLKPTITQSIVDTFVTAHPTTTSDSTETTNEQDLIALYNTHIATGNDTRRLPLERTLHLDAYNIVTGTQLATSSIGTTIAGQVPLLPAPLSSQQATNQSDADFQANADIRMLNGSVTVDGSAFAVDGYILVYSDYVIDDAGDVPASDSAVASVMAANRFTVDGSRPMSFNSAEGWILESPMISRFQRRRASDNLLLESTLFGTQITKSNTFGIFEFATNEKRTIRWYHIVGRRVGRAFLPTYTDVARTEFNNASGAVDASTSRIVFGPRSNGATSNKVVCFSTATCTKLWERAIGTAFSLANATWFHPVLDGEKIYVAGTDNVATASAYRIFELDLATGDLLRTITPNQKIFANSSTDDLVVMPGRLVWHEAAGNGFTSVNSRVFTLS